MQIKTTAVTGFALFSLAVSAAPLYSGHSGVEDYSNDAYPRTDNTLTRHHISSVISQQDDDSTEFGNEAPSHLASGHKTYEDLDEVLDAPSVSTPLKTNAHTTEQLSEAVKPSFYYPKNSEKDSGLYSDGDKEDNTESDRAERFVGKERSGNDLETQGAETEPEEVSKYADDSDDEEDSENSLEKSYRVLPDDDDSENYFQSSRRLVDESDDEEDEVDEGTSNTDVVKLKQENEELKEALKELSVKGGVPTSESNDQAKPDDEDQIEDENDTQLSSDLTTVPKPPRSTYHDVTRTLSKPSDYGANSHESDETFSDYPGYPGSSAELPRTPSRMRKY